MVRFRICAVFIMLALPNISAARPVNQLTQDSAMSFGTIIIDRTGDTITLNPNGNISAQKLSMFTGIPSAAQFSARGDKNAAVFISFSSGNTLTGAGTPMQLTNFTTNAGSSPAFDAGGRISFRVGASLSINPAQSQGNYSGSYVITLDYP